MAKSLTSQTETLRLGSAPIATLEGSAGGGGAAPAGLAGAASLTVDAPFGQLGELTDGLGEQMAAALSFDIDKVLAPAGALAHMRGTLQAPPRGALDGYGIKMQATEAGLSRDFPTAVAETADRLNAIFDKVPADPSALASLLLDQVVAVFGTLDGPEAQTIRSWIATVEELHRDLMPIIEAAEGEGSGEPMTIAIEVIGRAIRSTASVFGLDDLATLLSAFDRLLADPLPAVASGEIESKFTAVGGALAAVKAEAAGDVQELRLAVLAAADQMRALKELLRPAMDALEQIATAKLLQPGELGHLLSTAIERALGVKVRDVAKVDDPYKALLDRIDAAIAGVDLASVRTSVLGALHDLRDAIAGVDLGAAGDALRAALEPVQGAVDDLQAGSDELLEELRGTLAQAAGSVRTLAETVGSFAPDGVFTFTVAGDVHDALIAGRRAIGGDPADPSAPSVAGTLKELKLGIDGFLQSLTDVLEPVKEGIEDAAATVVEAVGDFATFVGELDVAGLVEDLRAIIDGAVHELTPIEFKALADPVIAELDENAEKMRAIDTSKLNDLLRAALATALDLVIAIDFTATISDPLKAELVEVKKVPAAAAADLQQRYEQALGFLDALRPEQLLEALFDAFDVVREAVAPLDAAKLLAPLDALHERHLHQPVAALKPALLLKPLQDAFDELREAVGGLKGADLLAPVIDGLTALQTRTAAFDLTGPVDDLRGELARLTARLQAMKPSGLIEPIAGDLDRLMDDLDRFKPSKVFAPVAALAAPLLELLEDVEQEAVTALFDAVRAPLSAVERLHPEKLQAEVQGWLDTVIATIEALRLPQRYEALRQAHSEIHVAAEAEGGALRADLVLYIDVELQLKGFVTAHDLLLGALRNLRRELRLDGLQHAYDELQQRLLDMLPPWGRVLLDPADFKRLMALASPLRFVDELDARYEAIKQKLLPISPQEIAAELDAAHAEILEQVAQLGLDERLVQVKELVEQLRGLITGLRIDFVTTEVDRALADVQAVVEALDPSALAPDLDAVHAEVLAVVDQVKPSLVLAGLDGPIGELKEIVDAVDPRTRLGLPLADAWQAVDAKLEEVDLTAVLSPINARLDELEADFETQLGRVEDAFDDMLRAARSALSGAGASASASIGGGF